MRYLVFTFLAISSLLNVACTSTLPTLKPYKMDIQQGNVVTYKMVQQLRPGMTKSQVRFIMGTPMLQDSFHSNRWDYFYQFKRGGEVQDQRRVILEFKDEQLFAVRGDQVTEDVVDPISKTKADLIEPQSKQTLAERLQFWKEEKKPGAVAANTQASSKEEKGLLDSLKFWKSDSEATKPEQTVQSKPQSTNEAAVSTQSATAATVESAASPSGAAESPRSLLAVDPAEAAARNASESSAQASSASASSSLLAVPAVEAAAAAAATAVVASPTKEAAPSEPEKPASLANATKPESKPMEVSQSDESTTAAEPMRPYSQTVEPSREPALPLDPNPIEMQLIRERVIAVPSSRMKPRELTPLSGWPVRLQFDKQLRPEFLPNPATEAAKEGPAEAGPGYFERLLEKIGF